MRNQLQAVWTCLSLFCATRNTTRAFELHFTIGERAKWGKKNEHILAISIREMLRRLVNQQFVMQFKWFSSLAFRWQTKRFNQIEAETKCLNLFRMTRINELIPFHTNLSQCAINSLSRKCQVNCDLRAAEMEKKTINWRTHEAHVERAYGVSCHSSTTNYIFVRDKWRSWAIYRYANYVERVSSKWWYTVDIAKVPELCCYGQCVQRTEYVIIIQIKSSETFS